MVQPFIENSTGRLKKLKIELTFGPTTPTSGYMPKRIESKTLKRCLYAH